MILAASVTAYGIVGFLVGALTIWSCVRRNVTPRQPVLRIIYLILTALSNAILWPITLLAAVIDIVDMKLQARQAASVRYKLQKFMDEYGNASTSTQRTTA